ncbi:unnamed protein product [Albugo candida]|nr:unnamed protein product [Albugo candida]|eukprot:CCI44901.1 unnamed protein product [Albugo candida]
MAATSMSQKEQSVAKRQEDRKRLRIRQLERSYEKLEYSLRHTPRNKRLPEKKKPHGPKLPHEWKLKGAARSAALLARIEAGELNEYGEELPKPEEVYDLFTMMHEKGCFATNDDTKQLLVVLRDLAGACWDAQLTNRAIQYYQQYLDLDPQDTFMISEDYVCALIDEGRGVEARQVIKTRTERVENSAILAYCQVLLEYISWEVLEEANSCEEHVREALQNAFKLNPFIAVFLAAHETFLDVVEYVEEIRRPTKAGSIDECFVYASKNIGVWIDTVGACAWIEKELLELPTPIATEKNTSDEMYLGMYQSAVEMHKERDDSLTDESVKA